jgi:hypothetical protein
MGKRTFLISLIIALSVVPIKVEAQSVCKMTEQQAGKLGPMGAPSGIAASLDPTTRHRLLVAAIFQIAQSKCEIFNYQEALAAMQANTMVDTISPPNRP